MNQDLLSTIKNSSVWGRNQKTAFIGLSWQPEINKWLAFIQNERQLEKYLPRLRARKKEWDKALFEIAVPYYLYSYRNCKIVEWFQGGHFKNEVEFAFESPQKEKIFCEIKRPGWDSEFSVTELKAGRLEVGKYLNGEARSYDNVAPIRFQIEKVCREKILRKDFGNLLVFIDDLMVSLSESDYEVRTALYYKKLNRRDERQEGCFVSHVYEKLSGIAIFNVQILCSGEVVYYWKYYENPNALIPIKCEAIKYPPDGVRFEKEAFYKRDAVRRETLT